MSSKSKDFKFIFPLIKFLCNYKCLKDYGYTREISLMKISYGPMEGMPMRDYKKTTTTPPAPSADVPDRTITDHGTGLSSKELALGPEFFPQMMETMFDSIIVCDLEGHMVYANEAASLSRGYTREEFRQLKVCDLVIPSLKETCMRRFKEIAGGQLTSFESVHLHKDGHHLYVEARVSLIELNGYKYYVLALRDTSERVASERQLKETKELLYSILENAPMAIYHMGVDGRYRMVNPAWEHITGKKKDCVVGHTFEELFSEGTAASCREVKRQVIMMGEPGVFEEKTVISGERKYFHTILFPHRNDEAQVTGITGISTDITKGKKSEETLREREVTLKTLIDANPESFFLIDAQGIILAANRVMAQRLGKNPEEIIGTSIYDHTPPHLVQRRRAFVEQSVDTGRPVHFEDTRDNFHFELYINPISDLDGKVSQLAILGVDITERKHMEVALRESEARYRAVTESSFAGVVVIQDGTLRYVNAVGAAIFGYTPEELIDKMSPLELVHPEDRPLKALELEKRLEGTVGPGVNNFKGLRKDGSVIHCEVWSRKIELQGRTALIVTLLDITERKRAQEALQDSEAKYRELVENANSIILRIDTQGNITFLNEYGQKFFGYAEDEIIGKNVLGTILLERDTKGFDLAAMLQELVKFPDLHVMNENENITHDGKRVWVAWTNKGIYDQGGNLVELLGVGIDRTEQKQMAEALEQFSGELEQRVRERTDELEVVKARMQDIIATIPAVILTANIHPPHDVIFVSDHIRFMGYEPGEILSTPLFNLQRIHPDDLDKVKWGREVLFREGKLLVTHRIQKKDGTYAWVQTNARLQMNYSGKPTKIVACWTDVTHETKLEQKLEILSGPEKKISVWKKSSRVKEDLAAALLPQSWDRVQNCLQAACRGETTTGVALQLRSLDGTLLYGLLTAGPLQIDGADFYGAVGAIIELGHKKEGLH
jgi:PAS domain S-box-containing protein